MAYDEAETPSLGGYKLPVYVSAMRGRRYFIGLTALVLLGLFFLSDFLQFSTLTRKVTTSSPTSAPIEASDEPDTLDLIANGTLGFGAIYVLGLPERSDKRDVVELAAALTGLKITWVDGVPGDKMHTKATPPYPSTQITKTHTAPACRTMAR
jgi:hypothetical protein